MACFDEIWNRGVEVEVPLARLVFFRIVVEYAAAVGVIFRSYLEGDVISVFSFLSPGTHFLDHLSAKQDDYFTPWEVFFYFL